MSVISPFLVWIAKLWKKTFETLQKIQHWYLHIEMINFRSLQRILETPWLHSLWLNDQLTEANVTSQKTNCHLQLYSLLCEIWPETKCMWLFFQFLLSFFPFFDLFLTHFSFIPNLWKLCETCRKNLLNSSDKRLFVDNNVLLKKSCIGPFYESKS